MSAAERAAAYSARFRVGRVAFEGPPRRPVVAWPRWVSLPSGVAHAQERPGSRLTACGRILGRCSSDAAAGDPRCRACDRVIERNAAREEARTA